MNQHVNQQGHNSEQVTQSIESPTQQGSQSKPGGAVLTPNTTAGAEVGSNLASAPAARPVRAKKWLLRSLAFGLSATVSAVVGVALVLMTPLPSAIAPAGNPKPFSLNDLWQQGFRYSVTRPINVLVMGIDLPLNLPDNKVSDDVFAGRSDTMLLVHVDPTKQTISVLSVPRDTRVEIPSQGTEKINYANALGGPKLAAQVVSSTLNGVTIDRYVRVSTGAFRELVNLVGGIDVYVPERMEYEDQTQKLKIDLQPGQQTLTGEQAEQFARFRNDAYGDIGRVQRQQQVIRALREKLNNPTLITKLPQALELFQQYVDTNLSMEEMLALVNFGLDVGPENFQMVMLPGRFSTPAESVASYWLMDPVAKDQVMQEHFGVSPLTAVTQQHDPKALRVAVQNASSNPQLSSQVAAYLEAQGFSSVYVTEDWPDVRSQTQIIAQRGDVESARMLQTILGLGQIEPTSTGDIQSDLTIRVGSDWVEQPRLQGSH